VSIRRLLALALMAGMPKIASAQFTTFIPPRNVVQDSIKAAAVVQQQVQADSIARTQITNMKTWVDSAAGLAPTPTTAADSAAQATAVATTAATTTMTTDTTTFRNGMRAPATASSLPLLVLIGSLLLVSGLVIMRRPDPRAARVRARPRA
jgi:hypothetical protein